MKKILLATALISLGSIANAAPFNTVLGDQTLGGGTSTVTAGAAACTLLSADVKITLSAGNIGNASCEPTTGTMGVAMGNINGKGNVYSIGSTGGGITVTSGVTVSPAGIISAVANAADARSASS